MPRIIESYEIQVDHVNKVRTGSQREWGEGVFIHIHSWVAGQRRRYYFKNIIIIYFFSSLLFLAELPRRLPPFYTLSFFNKKDAHS